MGFELRRRVVLAFEPPFEGLEIVCEGTVTIRQFYALQELRAGADESAEGFRRVLEAWFEVARPTWNAEIDGQPVPCTVDAIMDLLPVDLAVRLIPAWREAVAGVPPASGGGSRSGDSPPTPELAELAVALPS